MPGIMRSFVRFRHVVPVIITKQPDMPFIGRKAKCGVFRFKLQRQSSLTTTREADDQMKCRHVLPPSIDIIDS